MYRICLLLVLAFCLSLQIAAQCSFNLKETNRQVFSNSFSYALFEDLDGDGLEDLFGYTQPTNAFPPNFQVQVYRRLGANSFDTTARSTSITGNAGIFGILGDVNADGKKDLIVTHQTNPLTVKTYLNDGTGNFSTATAATNIESGELFWAAGDLNNDGRADLVSASYVDGNGGSTNIAYRLAQPDNTFGASVFVKNVPGYLWSAINASGKSVYSFPVLVEDLNGDGMKDIAVAAYSGLGADYGWRVYVLTSGANLTFSQTRIAPFAAPMTRLRTYDLNGDGKKDFVSHSDGNRVYIALNNGDNTFTQSFVNLPYSSGNYYADNYNTKEFSVADFDNDGDLDLLFPGTKFYVLLRNQGNQTFNAEKYSPVFTNDAVADLDNDGKADIISLNRPFIDGAFSYTVGSNRSDFYLHNSVSFKKNVCSPPGQTKKVDFNGDGYGEVVFWNPTTGVWRNFSADPVTTVQWGDGALGDVPVPNDYDGDGKTDYGIYRKSTGTWWVKQSSNGVNFAVPFGIAEDKPVPADYDGDGKADLAVFRPSNGDWYFFFSATQSYGAVHFGIAEDKPVPTDYDGDGKADVSVYRPSTGVWYRLNSADLSIFIFQFGISTDKPVPADYDGDGKANLAVFRNGVWYVLRENLTSAIFNFGTTGDLPFFDEAIDSRILVYRRSSNQVYSQSAEFFPFSNPMNVSAAPDDILVSSVLPPE